MATQNCQTLESVVREQKPVERVEERRARRFRLTIEDLEPRIAPSVGGGEDPIWPE